MTHHSGAKIFILCSFLFLLACDQNDKEGRDNTNFTILKYNITSNTHQALLDIEVYVNPNPSINKVSNLKMRITSRISSNMSMKMQFLVTGMKVIPSNSITKSMPSYGTITLERDIYFIDSGSTNILIAMNGTLVNKNSFRKNLDIFFYVPSINTVNSFRK